MIEQEMQSQSTLRPQAHDLAVYDSGNRPHPVWEELAAAWRYRDLVIQLVARDIKVRYKRSVLGVAWTMLNPLGTMIVLTFVFSHLFRFTLPHYPVYVLSGILLWNLFSQSTTAAMSQLIWGAALLNRIYVPRTLFALSALGTGLVNVVIALLPLIAIMLITGMRVTPAILWLPAPLLLTAMFTLGVALLLSSVAVAFPDVVETYQIVLSAWYFVTPILYPKTILPATVQMWMNFNPMYYLVEAFRAPVYVGWPAGANTLLAAAGSAVVVLVVGWVAFTARADDIVYRV